MFPQHFCRRVEFHLIFQSFMVVHYLWRLVRKAPWLSLSGQWPSGNQWFQTTFDGGLVILWGELFQSSPSERVSSSRLVGIVGRRGNLWRRTFSWAFVRLFLCKHVSVFLFSAKTSAQSEIQADWDILLCASCFLRCVVCDAYTCKINGEPTPYTVIFCSYCLICNQYSHW